MARKKKHEANDIDKNGHYVVMPDILNEPNGSEATILGVSLYHQRTHKDEGKEDMLYIVYKDVESRKKVRMIREPTMQIYFANPDDRDFTTPREYFEIDRTYHREVNARGGYVRRAIMDEIEASNDPQSQIYNNIYKQAKATGNWAAMREVYKWPYTLFSDLKVEDYYRIMLGYNYNTMRNHLIDRCFLDIEADIYGLTSSEQNANLDKVNACTLIFTFDENRKEQITPKVFTLLLRDHDRYPQQRYFEDHQTEFHNMLHDELDHQKITKGGKEQIMDFPAEYQILMFDTEAELLVTIWQIINHFRPDILSVWNIAYDIPKLAARLQANGLNYVDVMCDPVFPKGYRFVEMNIDNRPSLDIADRRTFIRMASTTLFNDQMQSYAGIRKGRKAYGSNKLDNISKIELGVGKHEFGKGIDVTNAAIKDYWNFVYYNIIDVVRQVMIDKVTNDTMAMIYDMNQANCPLENLFKQTRYQKQIYYTNYLRKGFVPGNNPNVDYIKGESEESLERIAEMREARAIRMSIDDDDSFDATDREDEIESSDDVDDDIVQDQIDEEIQKAADNVAGKLLDIYEDDIARKLQIPGGMVGNPDFNMATGTELIKGVKSKHVHDDVMDMDYASEYPWAKYTRSLSKSTQIGRLIIPHKVSDRQNVLPMGQEKRIEEIKAYLPGAEFVEDYLSHDILSLGSVWFNLPTIDELDDMFAREVADGA